MAGEFFDRIWETTDAVGLTVPFALLGAVPGYRTFVAGAGDGTTLRYAVADSQDWEIRRGVIAQGAPDTISRLAFDPALGDASSTGAAIDWPSSGVRNISHVLGAADLQGFLTAFDGVASKNAADSPVNLGEAERGAIIILDASGGAITANLPSIAAVGPKYVVTLRPINVANAITLNADGTDTINGVSAIGLGVLNRAVTLKPDDASEWIVLAEAGGRVPVSQGGTGAATAAAARTNLGFDGASGVVVAGDLAIDAVETAKVKNGAITSEKLSADAKASIGDIKMHYGTTEPAGWEFMDGATIGSAASAASKKGNGYESLFTHLWNEDANLAVSGGRGASAAADWAADKTIALPDWRARMPLMLNNAGLPNGVNGTFTTRNLGDTGGEEDHTLTESELASHTHDYTRHSDTFPVNAGGTNVNRGNPTFATTATGGDQPHNNMPPYGVAAFLIFSGV